MRAEDWRVVQITQRTFPQATADTRLRSLVLKLPRQASAPANAAVSARHICDERARRRRFETIRLRDHVGDLITAPTVSLDSDRVLVHVAFIDDRLNAGQ